MAAGAAARGGTGGAQPLLAVATGDGSLEHITGLNRPPPCSTSRGAAEGAAGAAAGAGQWRTALSHGDVLDAAATREAVAAQQGAERALFYRCTPLAKDDFQEEGKHDDAK